MKTRDEVKEQIHLAISKTKRFTTRHKTIKQYTTEILFYTKEFDKFKPKFMERIYAIVNSLNDRPKCEQCNVYVNYENKGNYFKFCSLQCANKSTNKNQKAVITRQKTCLKLYGNTTYNNPDKISSSTNNQSEDRKQQIKNYRKEKYFKDNGFYHPMQNPAVFENHQKLSYKLKPFMFLSGKTIYVQGFEPQILKELVYYFEEEDIITGAKNVPEVWYDMENKKHRYFADIYIKSRNLIIEVKSTYTLIADKMMNKLKRQASINAGYNFLFVVGK